MQRIFTWSSDHTGFTLDTLVFKCIFNLTSSSSCNALTIDQQIQELMFDNI